MNAGALNPVETRLNEAIDQGMTTLQSMLALLAQERHALNAREIGQIDAMISEKKVLFNQLEVVYQAINNALIDLEIPVPPSGQLQFALKSQRFADATKDRLRSFLDLTKQCEGDNKINGSIINIGLKRTNGALSILFNAQRQTNTYDESGRSVTNSSSLTVTKA